jgi:hypothetical protein
MIVRLQVILEPEEADALLKLASAELREPREQMRLIIRRELVRKRLLQPERKRQQPQEARHA